MDEAAARRQRELKRNQAQRIDVKERPERVQGQRLVVSQLVV